MINQFSLIGIGALALSVAAISPARAANIITFDNNATACGGSTLCSTNGTTGYSGTLPFDITTINQWFQIDTSTSLLPGQPAETANAGSFLVTNNTGATLTGLTLTIMTTFTSSTASVGACGGIQGPSNICDNFQAGKGAGGTGTSFEALSGSDFDSCTNGAAGGGFPCFSTSGQAAANFKPNLVTLTFGGYSIAPGADFLITFSSFNNGVVAATPLPAALPLFATGLGALGLLGWRRKRKAQA